MTDEIRLTREQWDELDLLRRSTPEENEARWKAAALAETRACWHTSRDISSWDGVRCSECGARLVGEVWAAGYEQLVVTVTPDINRQAPSLRKVARPKRQDQTARIEHLEAQLRGLLRSAESMAKRVERAREVLR